MENYVLMISVLISGLVGGYLLRYLISRNKMVELAELKSNLIKMKDEELNAAEVLKNAEANLEEAKKQILLKTDALTAAEQELIKLRLELAHSEKDNVKAEDRLSQLEGQLQSEMDSMKLLIEERATLNQQLLSEKEKYAELGNIDLRIENFTNKVITTTLPRFNQENCENIKKELSPLFPQFKEMKERVDNSTIEAVKLSSQSLQKIDSVANSTLSLVTAMRGDNKTQGIWGEFTLQNCLEHAGLVEGVDFIAQGKNLNLKDENGRGKKPDFVINVPGNKHLVIDSKVSLTHHDRYKNEKDEEAKKIHLKSFVESVKQHIKDLGSKDYCDLSGLNLQSDVILFLPTDWILKDYIENDKNYLELLRSNRVQLSSPMVLAFQLSNVARAIDVEKQHKNFSDIIKIAGHLCDNIASTLEETMKLEKHIKDADSSITRLTSGLTTGPTSMLSRCNRLKESGVKSKKKIPKTFVDVESDHSADAMPELEPIYQ